MFFSDLSPAVRQFISRFIRSVEQLEILLLLSRAPEKKYTASQVYDVILSTPQSVEGWLNQLTRDELLIRSTGSPQEYQCTSHPETFAQIETLGEWYRAAPVRVIEAIYQRESRAAQSFADAFKLKNREPNP